MSCPDLSQGETVMTASMQPIEQDQIYPLPSQVESIQEEPVAESSAMGGAVDTPPSSPATSSSTDAGSRRGAEDSPANAHTDLSTAEVPVIDLTGDEDDGTFDGFVIPVAESEEDHLGDVFKIDHLDDDVDSESHGFFIPEAEDEEEQFSDLHVLDPAIQETLELEGLIDWAAHELLEQMSEQEKTLCSDPRPRLWSSSQFADQADTRPAMTAPCSRPTEVYLPTMSRHIGEARCGRLF